MLNSKKTLIALAVASALAVQYRAVNGAMGRN